MKRTISVGSVVSALVFGYLALVFIAALMMFFLEFIPVGIAHEWVRGFGTFWPQRFVVCGASAGLLGACLFPVLSFLNKNGDGIGLILFAVAAIIVVFLAVLGVIGFVWSLAMSFRIIGSWYQIFKIDYLVALILAMPPVLSAFLTAITVWQWERDIDNDLG